MISFKTQISLNQKGCILEDICVWVRVTRRLAIVQLQSVQVWFWTSLRCSHEAGSGRIGWSNWVFNLSQVRQDLGRRAMAAGVSMTSLGAKGLLLAASK
eukprot:6479948-Amphidinium_carterae.3